MADTVKSDKQKKSTIPFLDLRAQYGNLRAEIREAMDEVLDSQAFILGATVKEFEDQVASYLGSRHAIGVASGTDALLLSLMSLGIGPGDAVVVPSFTFFSSASCISRLGATPLFVDIDPDTFLLDTHHAAAVLTERSRTKQLQVKAILPVHLFGQCCNMDQIRTLAERHHLRVIEDVAQAFGAKFQQEKEQPKAAGTLGDLGCYSFFPTKSLGGFGDGGLVSTDDQHLADLIRKLRVHGQGTKYYHEAVGINSRLDALQAAILRVKLRHVDEWCNLRIEHARTYGELFSASGLVIKRLILVPSSGSNRSHIHNYYVIRAERRDELRAHLAKSGIQTLVYYPLPLHLQPCFEYLGYRKGDLPESERVSTQALALPMYPELSREQQETVVQAIVDFYRS